MDDYERIFDEHFHSTYKYIFYMVGNKADAEDITQEIFMKVAGSYRQFRGDSTVATWIYSIARRTMIDFIRHKQTKKFITFWKHYIPENYDAADDIDHPGVVIEKKEQKEEIHQYIRKLPEKMRSVIYLRYIQGLSVQETALLLDLSPNRISVIQNRALAKLRYVMGKELQVKEGIR